MSRCPYPHVAPRLDRRTDGNPTPAGHRSHRLTPKTHSTWLPEIPPATRKFVGRYCNSTLARCISLENACEWQNEAHALRAPAGQRQGVEGPRPCGGGQRGHAGCGSEAGQASEEAGQVDRGGPTVRALTRCHRRTARGQPGAGPSDGGKPRRNGSGPTRAAGGGLPEPVVRPVCGPEQERSSDQCRVRDHRAPPATGRGSPPGGGTSAVASRYPIGRARAGGG